MGRSICRAGQNFLFAGPAFALDESAGDASAGIGVLAVIDREGEEVDAFPRVGRGDRGGQNHGFARGDQCSARGLLGHAPGLKDQPLAAGKLDGYFMLVDIESSFRFFRLGNLWVGRRRRVRQDAMSEVAATETQARKRDCSDSKCADSSAE